MTKLVLETKRLIVLLSLIMSLNLTGCATARFGGAEFNNGMDLILTSDLESPDKLTALGDFFDRMDQQGQNILTGLDRFLLYLVTLGTVSVIK